MLSEHAQLLNVDSSFLEPYQFRYKPTLFKTHSCKLERGEMNIPKGEMKRQSTGAKIQHAIGGTEIGGEAANSVQKVWTDNTTVLIASFINGFGRRQKTTLWDGTAGKLTCRLRMPRRQGLPFENPMQCTDRCTLKAFQMMPKSALWSPMQTRTSKM